MSDIRSDQIGFKISVRSDIFFRTLIYINIYICLLKPGVDETRLELSAAVYKNISGVQISSCGNFNSVTFL
jgi:hypothetical protein